MPSPNFIILYVSDPRQSADFYARLLNLAPVEASDTFALFALESGGMLGLWSKHTVEPAATASGGGAEVAFSVADSAMVNRLFATWSQHGLFIAQAPIEMDFGYTFVALDPDEHRLRVFTPTAP